MLKGNVDFLTEELKKNDSTETFETTSQEPQSTLFSTERLSSISTTEVICMMKWEKTPARGNGFIIYLRELRSEGNLFYLRIWKISLKFEKGNSHLSINKAESWTFFGVRRSICVVQNLA